MDKQELNSDDKGSNNLGLLGDYLKQKRVDKNYSLEKLSQKTKISVNILKALEANDYDHLPSAAYIKGFVTSYVKVLGLPLDEAITKMESTYLNILGKPFPALNHTKSMPAIPGPIHPASFSGKAGPNDEPQTAHDVIEKGDSIIDNTKSMLPIIIFGVVVLVLIGGYKLISSVVESEVTDQKTKNLGPVIEPSSALVKHPPKPDAKPVEVKPEEAATPATTATPPAEVKPEEPKVEPDLPRNFPTIEFKKVRGKLYSIKTDAPENQDESILPKQIKDSMNSDLQNLYIKAVDGNTWLSYKIDANPIESVILNKDSDLFLQGSEIRIFLGNVNVTRIFYNNYLIDAPTKSGVKSLVFPEESNGKFMLPLFPKAKDDILYTAEDYIKRMKLEEDESAKRKQAQ